MTASPTAQESGAPSQVWPSVNRLDPRAIASYTCSWHRTAPMAVYPAPSPFAVAMMSGPQAVAAPANQPPGTTHAGHDLVEAHEEAVTLAPLGKAFPEPPRRWGVGGQGRRRADGLAEERRDLLGTRLRERLVQGLERRSPVGSKRQVLGGMWRCRGRYGSKGRCSPDRPVSASVSIVGPW